MPFRFTVRNATVLWVVLPEVAAMVSGKLPKAVAAAAEIFRVAVPEPLMEAGVKLPVVPAGSPLTLRDTLPLNPLTGVMAVV